jgi:hypothetical protein
MLTDDEAAAIALVVGGAWSALLPTVDEDDENSVVPAIMRGRRSMVIRGLASEDGLLVGDAAQVVGRLGDGPRAMFLVVDAAGSWVTAGPTIYLYGPATENIEMSHLVSPAGVHAFRIDPPARQWWALTQLAEAVFNDGFTAAGAEERQPAAARLGVTREDGTRAIQVAKGSVSVAQGPIAGTFPSVAAAVAWLTG